MNISQYWQLPIQEKKAIYREVIKPLEHCETCGRECTEDGFTCFWCEAVICPLHVKTEQWQGMDIQICESCHSWSWQR